MDRDYWIKKWKNDKIFVVENDRLKPKSYIYTPFPKANLFGFQNGDFRKLVCCDIFARSERFKDNNVLFPTGCHSLCNTSFVENKKYSNLLNDDISDMFTNQMLKLGIGINDNKHIDMRHDEYLSNLQQAFIDLYEKGYIEYKDTKVYFDKKYNKIYDYMNKPKNAQIINQRCFVLKIEEFIDDIINEINKLEIVEYAKDKMINALKPKRLMSLSLGVSNGSSLKISTEDPQFLGGISYIFLNPEYIDITDYVDVNEYNSVFSYLEEANNDTLFVFTGLHARNPLTGKDIPLFISTIFPTDAYLGIPAVDIDDRALALENELEIIEIIDNGLLTNSDFLDGLSIDAAKNNIFEAFLDAEIASEEIIYLNKEIVLSSLDNFGPLFPFLEDKDNNNIVALTGHLPYAFSSKLRPVLVDNVDIIGTTMNGTINNLFTEGLCPIIAMLYDDIGSIIPIFSKDALREYESWKQIKYTAVADEDIYSSILMPIIFHLIIQKESKKLPSLFTKIDVYTKCLDLAHKDIKRANNNLIDVEALLAKNKTDSVRLYMASIEPQQEFLFDIYQIEDANNMLINLEECLMKDAKPSAMVDYQLFNLTKGINEALEIKNINEYAKLVTDFINNQILQYGLSKDQTLTFLKLIYPLFPFMAERVYKSLTNNKYSIVNEAWPN